MGEADFIDFDDNVHDDDVIIMPVQSALEAVQFSDQLPQITYAIFEFTGSTDKAIEFVEKAHSLLLQAERRDRHDFEIETSKPHEDGSRLVKLHILPPQHKRTHTEMHALQALQAYSRGQQ